MRLPTDSSPIDESGVLTFDPTKVAGLNANFKSTHLIRSYNNLEGTSDVNIDGTGVVIPPQSVYLRAVGVDHGVEKMMECVIWVPPFPYSMASGGPIKVAGQSKIASVKNLADAGDPTKWLPGSLVTNSANASDALVMEDDSLVTGDVQASGGATISPNTVIKGERRFNAPPVRIPNLRIEDYDTSAKTGVTTYNSSSPASNQVDGFAYRDGSLNFNSGVTLNGGVVYVKGDLTVNGQISGEGALIATGKLTVNGASQSSSNNKVALLSKQDMTLTGTSSNHVGATGLLYTEGKLQADYADITGSAAAPTQDSGAIQMSNVNVLQNPAVSNITLQVGGPPSGPPPMNFSEASLDAAPYLGSIVRLNQSYLISDAQIPFKSRINVTDPNRFKDSATGEFHLPIPMTSQFARDINGATLPDGVYESKLKPDGLHCYQIPSTSGVPPLTEAEMTVTVNGINYAGSDPLWRGKLKDAIESKMNSDVLPAGDPLTTAELTQLTGPGSISDAYIFGQGSLLNYFGGFRPGPQNISNGFISYNTALANSSGPGETVTFTLNPGLSNGNFINLADRVRILYWREVPQ